MAMLTTIVMVGTPYLMMPTLHHLNIVLGAILGITMVQVYDRHLKMM